MATPRTPDLSTAKPEIEVGLGRKTKSTTNADCGEEKVKHHVGWKGRKGGEKGTLHWRAGRLGDVVAHKAGRKGQRRGSTL